MSVLAEKLKCKMPAVRYNVMQPSSNIHRRTSQYFKNSVTSLFITGCKNFYTIADLLFKNTADICGLAEVVELIET